MISSKNIHCCLNCGCIYSDQSRQNPLRCPICGKGLSHAQDVEGIHY